MRTPVLVFGLALATACRSNDPPPAAATQGTPLPREAWPKAPADPKTPPADATRTPSGLAWTVLAPGRGGPSPSADATVTIHYVGWGGDGSVIDGSIVRGTPARFPIARTIPGWREALTTMTPGEKRRLWVPARLAYDGAPGKPAGPLLFDLHLLEVEQSR